MGVIELGVADMIVVIITLAICVVLLTIKMFNNETRLNRLEGNDDALETAVEGLSERCDTHKKSIEYLSKSVRELNGVVEAAVKVKEKTPDDKPDEKTYWLDDILDKIRKRKEKPIDAPYYLGVGVDGDKMLKIPVRDTGQTLVDGEPIRHGRLWTNADGRIYELPEGCFILGDTPYEMDQ